MQFDTIIENPRIYDGSGRRPRRNDVAISGDRIAAIGDLKKAQAATRISANKLALCPGFIDVHSHADMGMHHADHIPVLEPLVRQGITTYVGGNCGVGMGPISPTNDVPQFEFYNFFLGEDQRPHIHWKSFGEMMEAYEGHGMLLNAALLTGHGILRMDAMGDKMDLASQGEVRHMRKKLAECLEAGSIGLSTGLQYFPGLNSDQWELTELAKEVKKYNGVFTSHLRSYSSDTLGKAIKEVLDIGRDAQVPVQISHLFWIPNLPGPLNGAMNRLIKGVSYLYSKKEFPVPIDSAVKVHLEAVARHIEKGYPVGIDGMPTSAGFTHLLAFFPPWSLQGGLEVVRARLADPEQRKLIRRSIEKGDTKWPHRGRDSWSMNLFKVMGWGCASIMSLVSEKNQPLVGKTLLEVGESRGVHPFDAMCDLLLEEDGRVLIFETATYPGDPLVERSLLGTLLDPNVSIVTDTIPMGFGLPSHLTYDCFPKFLGTYAREWGALSMQEAIRKSTSLPAKQLQIKQRGEVKEGYFADLVLFDENTIGTNGHAKDPAHFPSGIERVFINGHTVVDGDGLHADPRPGRMLRRGA